MELNSGDSVQRQRFGNVVNFDENGHRMIVGRMDLFAHKECPSCYNYLMFNRKENFNCIKRVDKGDICFYKSPCCKCRVKAFPEEIVNY